MPVVAGRIATSSFKKFKLNDTPTVECLAGYGFVSRSAGFFLQYNKTTQLGTYTHSRRLQLR